MNSYEIVKRAIEFNNPERLPCQFSSLGFNDTHHVGWNQIGTGDNTKKEALDEWGCLWSRTDVANVGQIKGHPLSSWDLIDSFQWPDPNNPKFYTGMEERFKGSEGKYITTEIFMLIFERIQALRGFENTMEDLYLEREKIEMLADRIVDYDNIIIENISKRFPGQIHGFFFSDDWGTELSTFISPNLWAEFFKPRYKKVFDTAKKAGWHIWMHSCGKVNGIIDGLIEIGVDVLNLQQPRALGIEEVGKQFAGRVCFSSLCDIQHTLPFKDGEEIEEEARLLLNCWGTDRGGFILSDYSDSTAIGVTMEKKKLMFDAFKKYDRWKKP